MFWSAPCLHIFFCRRSATCSNSLGLAAAQTVNNISSPSVGPQALAFNRPICRDRRNSGRADVMVSAGRSWANSRCYVGSTCEGSQDGESQFYVENLAVEWTGLIQQVPKVHSRRLDLVRDIPVQNHAHSVHFWFRQSSVH